MRAVDVVESLPTASPDDDALAAVRAVVQSGLPALVVVDDSRGVIGCVAATDLIRLALPRYLQEDPGLARVFDEAHADRIAARLVGTRVRDLIADSDTGVPVVRPEATAVELAEAMVQAGCPIAIVAQRGQRPLGVVTANRLLEQLLAATEDTTR